MKKIEPLDKYCDFNTVVKKINDLVDSVNSLIPEEPKTVKWEKNFDPSPKQSLKEWCADFDKRLSEVMKDKKEEPKEFVSETFEMPKGTPKLKKVINSQEPKQERLSDMLEERWIIDSVNYEVKKNFEKQATAALNFILNHPEFPAYKLLGDNVLFSYYSLYNQALIDVKKFLETLKSEG